MIKWVMLEYIIEEPKISRGKRYVPMDEKVDKRFKRILANHKSVNIEPIVNGVHGFLFLDKNNKPMVALHWEKYFQHICQKYNKIYKIEIAFL